MSSTVCAMTIHKFLAPTPIYIYVNSTLFGGTPESEKIYVLNEKYEGMQVDKQIGNNSRLWYIQ